MRLLPCLGVLLLYLFAAAVVPAVQGSRTLQQDAVISAINAASNATIAINADPAAVSTAVTTAATADAASISVDPTTTSVGDASTEQPAEATPVAAQATVAVTTPRHTTRNNRQSVGYVDSAATAAATCGWPGHCACDPCVTYNDCFGTMTCNNGKCGTSCSTPTPPPATCNWPGHCLGDPCKTYDDCDGALICISERCAVSGPAPSPSPTPTPSPSPSSSPFPSPSPSGSTPGQGQCPNGWYEATLTVYDSWPYPNSKEWASYSGGQYLGMFAYKSTSAACNQNGEVYLNSWSVPSGRPLSRTFPAGCHWRHDWVANTKIASVFKAAGSPVNISFNSQIAGKQIRVASIADAKANPAGAGTLVLAADTCGDTDCAGCCTNSANKSPSKMLVDLEKNAMKAVFPGIKGFVPTSITYSRGRAAYQGSTFDVSTISGYPSTVCFRLQL